MLHLRLKRNTVCIELGLLVMATVCLSKAGDGNKMCVYNFPKMWHENTLCGYFYSIKLHELAELMLSMGVINAINFDGGGSVTAVLNGQIINYPSDKW